MSTNVKKRKLSSLIGNIVLIAVVVIIALIAIMRASSFKKGYNSMFGTAFIAVKTDSMQGDKKDNFKRGAMLFVDVLTDEEKFNLTENSVITFNYYNTKTKSDMIITHRIVGIKIIGESKYYICEGDYNPSNEKQEINFMDVIGVYKGHAAGLGFPTLLLESKWGFFGIVLVPCFLLVFYCVFKVIMSMKHYKMEKNGIDPDLDPIEAIGQKEAELKKREEELLARIKALEDKDKSDS